MIKVCHNDMGAIYDMGDHWLWVVEGQPDQLYYKTHQPLFPLAAVIKYEMTPDNKEILDILRQKNIEIIREGLKEHGRN